MKSLHSLLWDEVRLAHGLTSNSETIRPQEGKGKPEACGWRRRGHVPEDVKSDSDSWIKMPTTWAAGGAEGKSDRIVTSETISDTWRHVSGLQGRRVRKQQNTSEHADATKRSFPREQFRRPWTGKTLSLV